MAQESHPLVDHQDIDVYEEIDDLLEGDDGYEWKKVLKKFIKLPLKKAKRILKR